MPKTQIGDTIGVQMQAASSARLSAVLFQAARLLNVTITTALGGQMVNVMKLMN